MSFRGGGLSSEGEWETEDIMPRACPSAIKELFTNWINDGKSGKEEESIVCFLQTQIEQEELNGEQILEGRVVGAQESECGCASGSPGSGSGILGRNGGDMGSEDVDILMEEANAEDLRGVPSGGDSFALREEEEEEIVELVPRGRGLTEAYDKTGGLFTSTSAATMTTTTTTTTKDSTETTGTTTRGLWVSGELQGLRSRRSYNFEGRENLIAKERIGNEKEEEEEEEEGKVLNRRFSLNFGRRDKEKNKRKRNSGARDKYQSEKNHLSKKSKKQKEEEKQREKEKKREEKERLRAERELEKKKKREEKEIAKEKRRLDKEKKKEIKAIKKQLDKKRK